MTDNVIQHQIRLVTFRAAKVELSCHPLPEDFEGDFQIKLGDLLIPEKPNYFAKVFTIDIKTTSFGTEMVHVNVEYHTVFECSHGIDENFLRTEFGRISAPAIGFPFVRAFISTLSLQAGLAPIILPSINFVQFSKEMEGADIDASAKS